MNKWNLATFGGENAAKLIKTNRDLQPGAKYCWRLKERTIKNSWEIHHVMGLIKISEWDWCWWFAFEGFTRWGEN